jgi:SAM-dependent methyltransferase
MQEYIHGSSRTERQRLALMNRLINPGCLEAMRLTDERRVLDMGSGTGLFSRAIADRLGAGAQVVGIESDAEQIREAEKLRPKAANLEFRQGDAANPPLAAGEWGGFDLAHSRFLLEHLADPQTVVDAMVQAVRPGGRVVLLDDDHDLMRLWPEPDGFTKLWSAYYRSYRPMGNDPLIGRRLPELLMRAGATPVRITQVFYGGCSGAADFGGIVDNLVGVMAGARDTVLAGGEIGAGEFDAALQRFSAFAREPGAALWYVINYAEGIVE